MSGIYIHIPYCKQACHYCDFHFSTNTNNASEMLEAMCKELVVKKDFLDNSLIETIYFGGGTPSFVTSKFLEKIIATIEKNYTLDLKEITLEANPDDVSKEKLKDWQQIGFNRLSIGIQSFDSEVLNYMNRCHNGKDAERAVKTAQDIGFDNLNLDLIFGTPNFNPEISLKDLEKIIELEPKHIATYCMTIEEKTVFGKKYSKGELIPFPDEDASALYQKICDRLLYKGFDHYEISNFSVPNYHSKHNLSYWEDKKFIGIGPSAHSFDGEKRYVNTNNNQKYIHQLSNGLLFFETETLSPENKINEFIMTKLRTKWGINHKKFIALFGLSAHDKLLELGEKWAKEEHLIIDKEKIVLSKSGKLFADSICEDLFQ
jgi:oxygen-independent coproporphyrinogen III oxidase